MNSYNIICNTYRGSLPLKTKDKKQESGGGKDRNLGKENNWNRNDEQRGRLERMTIRNNKGRLQATKN